MSAARQHEVPTHLNVEDKVAFGLTARQFLYMLVGSSASYVLWEQTAPVPEALRGPLVGIVVLATLVFALLRPAGRPVEEWLAAGLVYATLPKQAVWQPADPTAEHWRPAGASWQELAPSLSWAEDDGT